MAVASSTANLGIRASAAQAFAEVNKLTASVFRFRDNVLRSHGVMINSFARVIRELARIRTAFFILITFLGIRPAIRLFNALTEQTAEARLAMAKVHQRWDILKNSLSKALVPRLAVALERLVIVLENFFRLLGNSPQIVDKFITTLSAMSTLVSNVGEAARVGFQTVFLPALKNLNTMLGAGTIQKSLVNILATIQGIQLAASDPLGFLGETVFSIRNIDAEATEAEKALNKIEGMRQRAIADIDEFVRESERINTLIDDFSLSLTALAVKSPFRDTLVAFGNTLKATFKEIAADLPEPGEEVLTAWTKLTAQVARFKEAYVAATGEMEQATERFATDVNKAVKEVMSDSLLATMQQKWDTFEDIAVKALQAVQKAIADFVAEAIQRELIQKGVGIIAGVLGGALGSLFSTAPPSGGGNLAASKTYGSSRPFSGIGTSARGHQHGGVVHGTELAMLHGPEAVVPLKGGAIPVRTLNGGGRATVVNFNISAADGPSVISWLKREKATIKAIIAEAGSGEDMGIRTVFKNA